MLRERAGPGAAPVVVLCIALLGVSGGAIFVRLAEAPPLAIAAWRIGLAACVVVPLALAFSTSRSASLHAQRAAVGAGVLLALHFATWIASLAYTSVAQSVVLATTAPIWVALLGRVLGIARVNAAGWLAIALCAVGSAVIAGGDLAGGGSWRGNALALAAAVCMGAYLLLAQSAQRELDFLGFVARSYGSAAVALWLAMLASGTAATGYAPDTWLAFAGLAIVSQLVGHGGANWSLRHLPPAFVALVLVGEPILASVLAWWLFDERIGALLWLGGGLILGGILLSARAMRAGTAAEAAPG